MCAGRKEPEKRRYLKEVDILNKVNKNEGKYVYMNEFKFDEDEVYNRVER